MNALISLSPEARSLLFEIRSCVDYWHLKPLDEGEDGPPALERLRGLAESLVCLIDSGEFDDARHLSYELRTDPDSDEPRDLRSLLRATDDEIEQAEAAADGRCERR